MAFSHFVVASLFISISTGGSLIAYPVFLQLFFPSFTDNRIYMLAFILVFYEAGRLVNNLITPRLINKLELKKYVWIILVTSLVLNILFSFTANFGLLVLVRLLLGIMTLQNNLSLILNSLFNLKNKPKLYVFTQISPNIIVIINFLAACFFYDNTATFDADKYIIMNAPHKRVGLFVVINYGLLIFILICSKSLSFVDSSYGTMVLPDSAIATNKRDSDIGKDITNKEKVNEYLDNSKAGDSKVMKSKRSLILFSDPNVSKGNQMKNLNESADIKDIIEKDENKLAFGNSDERNDGLRAFKKDSNEELENCNMKSPEKKSQTNCQNSKNTDISEISKEVFHKDDNLVIDVDPSHQQSATATNNRAFNSGIKLETNGTTDFKIKRTNSQASSVNERASNFNKDHQNSATEEVFNRGGQSSIKLKMNLIQFFSTFNNGIMFNTMLLFMYFNLKLINSNDITFLSFELCFSLIYLIIGIFSLVRTFTKASVETEYSFVSFAVGSGLTSVLSFVTFFWLLSFSSFRTELTFILIFGVLVFSAHSITSQFVMIEYNKSLQNLDKAMREWITQSQLHFTIPSRTLAIFLQFCLNYIGYVSQNSSETLVEYNLNILFNSYLVILGAVLPIVNIILIRLI